MIVTYDAQGVPHIAAAQMPDLFFAQGYVTAQDRLWQMDMTRRYASGDLAAVLGADYVKIDREQRILGLRQVAQQAVANMVPEVRLTSTPMPPGSTPTSSSIARRCRWSSASSPTSRVPGRRKIPCWSGFR